MDEATLEPIPTTDSPTKERKYKLTPSAARNINAKRHSVSLALSRESPYENALRVLPVNHTIERRPSLKQLQRNRLSTLGLARIEGATLSPFPSEADINSCFTNTPFATRFSFPENEAGNQFVSPGDPSLFTPPNLDIPTSPNDSGDMKNDDDMMLSAVVKAFEAIEIVEKAGERKSAQVIHADAMDVEATDPLQAIEGYEKLVMDQAKHLMAGLIFARRAKAMMKQLEDPSFKPTETEKTPGVPSAIQVEQILAQANSEVNSVAENIEFVDGHALNVAQLVRDRYLR